ncbi:EI24 domain-containing protein [Olleya sp. R77988]|uniref:EI24 domain-containing protein n=1 Tax=Olleya sp. R77988 TaxID=3093875 RepID=UPI0037C7CAE7
MIQNIIKGINGYSGAFALISKLKLWKYFFIPIIISVIVAITIGFSAYGLSDNVGNYIAKIWFWDWGKDTFTSFSTIISFIIIFAIGLIFFKHIIMALSAPFMGPVSEKIETHLTGVTNHNHRKTSFEEQLWRGIKINFRNLTRELLITVPILLLKFIPVVNIFSAILLLLIQGYYAGFGNMDYTLERHFNFKESVNFVRRNRGLAIGNGLVFIMLLIIPVIGVVLVLPLSVTAGSITTIKQIKTENQKLLQ